MILSIIKITEFELNGSGQKISITNIIKEIIYRMHNMNNSKSNLKKDLPKNILTIGAYERDNLGDLLFFIIFEKALKNFNCNLVAGSIIFSDMRKLLGRFVYPYDQLLNDHKWDAVLVLGGEIGRCSIPMAIRISLGTSNQINLKEFENSVNNYLAYLPDTKKYEKNKNTLFMINSVGGFSKMKDNKINEEIKDILLSADKISVRTKPTQDYLNSIDVKNELVPDVVHVLPLYYPKKEIHKEEYFLFQMNINRMRFYSVENISKQLCRVIQKYRCKIYLFMAGTVKFHDNPDLYMELKESINNTLKGDWVEVISERNPLKLVEWISNSKLWMGSSLHGRIISIAYSIPRISFDLEKVNAYSALWDEQFPFNVKIDNLLESCEKALSVSQKEMDLKANFLTKKASDNLYIILKEIF